MTDETNAKRPEIIDIDLGFVEKQKFRIGGDDGRILELNVSDLNIAQRLKIGYPQLTALLQDAQKQIEGISEDTDDFEALGMIADKLTNIDERMRQIIDYIFDTNASEICAPSGNMFDPVDGDFRYELILAKLTALYAGGLDKEFEAMKKKVAKKTSKYTGNK